VRRLVALIGLALATTAVDRDVRACSCVGPRLWFLSPRASDDAPRNVHVRVMVPTGTSTASLLLRVHGGADVPTQTKTYAGSSVTIAELVPTATLAAQTRFEVATFEPTAHPPTTVIGTFKTGATEDTSAPRLDSLGRPRTRINARYGGGDCSIHGPWIELANVAAHDDRGDEKLAFAVWGPDARGRLDTHRAPDTLVFPNNGRISIGQTSLCDTSRFPLSGSAVTLAVAAVDDAGNTSRALTFRADLTRNSP